MTCRLLALCIDANDPLRLARFWSGVLGWEMVDESRDGVALVQKYPTSREPSHVRRESGTVSLLRPLPCEER